MENGEILNLDIGGKDKISVRKSTLCHVKGSALEAMFSGRHHLQKTEDEARIFIDRNPIAFNLMLDFIRNSGEMNEVMDNNVKMLNLELKFWAIDDAFFKEQPKDKFEIIQDLVDGRSLDLYEDANGQEFFQEQLHTMANVNFKKMFE